MENWQAPPGFSIGSGSSMWRRPDKSEELAGLHLNRLPKRLDLLAVTIFIYSGIVVSRPAAQPHPASTLASKHESMYTPDGLFYSSLGGKQ